MRLQTERMREGDDGGGDDIDHSDVMETILLARVTMNIWMRVTAEVLMIQMMMESVIIQSNPGWKRVFNLSSDTVNT